MFTYNKFTVTQFLNYLDRFYKGYSITLLPQGKTRILYNDWYYYFDHNDIFWYKVPKEEI